MSRRIKNNLWQVGGPGITDQADAAVYVVQFDDRAALVDAGCGHAHSTLTQNIRECLPTGVQLEYLL